MKRIKTPFPEVTMYVIKMPRIGLLGTYRRVIAGRVASIPPEFVQCLGIVTKAISRRRSGTAGVLPFGFGGQAVAGLGRLIEVLDKLLYVVPRDAGGRVVGALVHKVEAVPRLGV